MPKIALQIENAVIDLKGSDWEMQLANISVKQGELHMVPTTASGYSTAILQLLTNAAKVESGEVTILGTRLRHASRHTLLRLRRSAAILSPELGMVQDWTILQNTMLPVRADGTSAKLRTKQALAVLSKLGLVGLSHMKVDQLPSSQRIIVSLAQAMVKVPKLIVAERCWSDEFNDKVLAAVHDLTLSGSTALLEGVPHLHDLPVEGSLR